MVSKKPKLIEKSDSDNEIDNQKSYGESDSDSTEEQFAEKFDRGTDWYIPTSGIKKTVILKVVFAIKTWLMGII